MKDKIQINAHYTRSVNLERDSNSIDVVSAYIPTSRALRTLSKIADTFHDQQAPRAWSLVGPYGSGKSSFSVFLAQLLSQPDDLATKTAYRVLSGTEKELATRFKQSAQNKNGYFKVLVTGAPEPLSLRLLKGFADAAQLYWSARKGRNPQVVTKLRSVVDAGDVSTTELVDLVKEVQAELSKSGSVGILLVIDELGKFLEYEARHYGANDIYILQTLAEHACEGSDVNLLMFVLLHQSFEQYAKGLGESLRNEWSKVQGRFEEVLFLESVEQTLRVVGAAFQQNISKQEKLDLEKSISKHVSVLTKVDALPGALTEKEATSLFMSCYPLHPVSAVLLPLLCQKVAQNERSLFSYLGSHEDFGLADMMQKLTTVGDFVYPHHIFDYFITNQSAVVGDYLTHRRWVEVVTAIERLGDAKPVEIELLKTIGILNIIGGKGGFKASKDILATTLTSKAALAKLSKELSDKSVVTYRRYNSEYRVWQGSDFDLETALQEEINNLGNFALAEELNSAKSLLPVVARKYTIKTGALRYFVPHFVDAKSYKSFPIQSEDPRIIFFLAGGQDDEKLFNKSVSSHFSDLDLVVLCLSGSQLREAVAETQALHRVRISRQELNSDPIAKREFEDRLTAAELSEDVLLLALLDNPEANHWYHKGQNKNVVTKRSLQQVMSGVLEEVYNLSPIILNELINRDKPSSTANAARNKLLFAMMHHENEKDLGIQKFPAEKAIYRSLLRSTGLHQEDEKGVLAFTEPGSKSDKEQNTGSRNLGPTWECINDFLDGTKKEAKSFAALNKKLMAPPYGVKAGVLPILYIAAYAVYGYELALYENRRYKPFFTEEMLERFVKRPDEFEFQRFRIEGLNASIFEQYSLALLKDSKPRTLLELAKPLAKKMGGLPQYTHHTRRGLGPKAQEVRTVFNLAKSPENLLLQDLPKALGFEGLNERATTKDLAEFSFELREVLHELDIAYSVLLDKQRSLLAQAFNIDPSLELKELRKVISGKCHGLENFTVDTQGLRAFIMRLTKATSDDEAWFENILMFLGHKPSKKWLDSDQDAAEHRLSDFSRRVIDLEQLSIYAQKKNTLTDTDFDVYLLRSVKKGGEFNDEVVAVDKATAKSIKETKGKLVEVLGGLKEKELRLAVLAETIDEFLIEYKKPQIKTVKKPSNKKVKIADKAINSN